MENLKFSEVGKIQKFFKYEISSMGNSNFSEVGKIPKFFKYENSLRLEKFRIS